MFDNDHESVEDWNSFLEVEAAESSHVVHVSVESLVDIADSFAADDVVHYGKLCVERTQLERLPCYVDLLEEAMEH